MPAAINALLDMANCHAGKKEDVFNLISLVCFLTKQRVPVVIRIQTKAAIDTRNIYEMLIFMILNQWAIYSPSPETYNPLRTAVKTILKPSVIDFFSGLCHHHQRSPNCFFDDMLLCIT